MTLLEHVPAGLGDLAQLSTEVLARELARRQNEDLDEPHRPECGSKHRGNYNTSLHVGALFLILVLSTLACSFPIIVRRFPNLPVPHRILFLSRHFGTGVLIATAFVHLLPTAFTSLTDPCLPPFWNEGYTPMAGFIAMLSVLVVVGIEMFFASRGAGHSHSTDYGPLAEPREHGGGHANGHARSLSREAELLVKPGIRHFRTGSFIDPDYDDAQEQPADDDVELNHRTSLDSLDDPLVSSHTHPMPRNPFSSPPPPNAPLHHRGGGGSSGGAATHDDVSAEQQKMLLQCLLLEAGILFHSVFIGMALSVAVGTPFLVLLVAISFHQTFEGLALGSRIAAITAFAPGSPKPWLMALAYGTTTPIGQAIGLFVHNLYDPQSQMGLLMVGIMNSISSGLLLFAGLVELLAEDFLSDKSYEALRGRKRIEACAAVVAGALLMALVGAFA